MTGTGGWLRVRRVAQYLDCSRDTVYDLVRSGQLEATRVGSQGMRISQKSLQSYVTVNRVPASEGLPEKN